MAAIGPKGRAMVYLPRAHEVHAYKQAVQLAARAAMAGMAWDMEGPMALRIVFLFPRPKKTVKTPRPRYRHTSRPDSDNLYKGVSDALNLVCYSDDAQVAHVEVEKWVAATGESPRTYVVVRHLD